MADEKKYTKVDFGKNIKTKYPQYKDVPDAELADKILAKYPQYKSSILADEVKKNPSTPASAQPVQQQNQPSSQNGVNSDLPIFDQSVLQGRKPVSTQDDFKTADGEPDVKAYQQYVKNVGETEYLQNKEALDPALYRKNETERLTKSAVSKQESILKNNKELKDNLNIYQYGNELPESRRLQELDKQLTSLGEPKTEEQISAYNALVQERNELLDKTVSDRDVFMEQMQNFVPRDASEFDSASEYVAYQKEAEQRMAEFQRLKGLGEGKQAYADKKTLRDVVGVANQSSTKANELSELIKKESAEADVAIQAAKELNKDKLEPLGFFGAFQEGMEQTTLANTLADLYASGNDERLAKSLESLYAEGVILPQETTKLGAVGEVLGGQVKPLAVGAGASALSPTAGVLAGSLYYGRLGLGGGLIDAYTTARSQGMTSPDALALAKKQAIAGGIGGVAEGAAGLLTLGGKPLASLATMPFKTAIKEALVDNSVDAVVAGVNQVVQNKNLQRLGLDRDLEEGVVENMAAELAFGAGMNLVIYGGSKIKGYGTIINNIAKLPLQEIQTNVDNAVSAGVVDAARGQQVISDVQKSRAAQEKLSAIEIPEEKQDNVILLQQDIDELEAAKKGASAAVVPAIENQIEDKVAELQVAAAIPLNSKESTELNKLQTARDSNAEYDRKRLDTLERRQEAVSEQQKQKSANLQTAQTFIDQHALQGSIQKNDFRPDFGMSSEELTRGIKQVQNGEMDKAAAKKVIGKINEWQQQGYVDMIAGGGGSKNARARANIPFELNDMAADLTNEQFEELPNIQAAVEQQESEHAQFLEENGYIGEDGDLNVAEIQRVLADPNDPKHAATVFVLGEDIETVQNILNNEVKSVEKTTADNNQEQASTGEAEGVTTQTTTANENATTETSTGENATTEGAAILQDDTGTSNAEQVATDTPEVEADAAMDNGEDISVEEENYTARAKRFADNIRKLKADTGNQIAMSTLIPVSAKDWNNVVEVAAKTIEAGGKVADAVVSAVDAVQNSDWYKKLTVEQQQDFSVKLTERLEKAQKENEQSEKRFNTWVKYAKQQFNAEEGGIDLGTFKERFNKRFNTDADEADVAEIFSEAQSQYNNTRDKKIATRQQVDKSFKTDKKVQVNERTALKDQLRLEARAAREGYAAGKVERRGFAKAIKQHLEDNIKNGSVNLQQARALLARANAVTNEGQLNNFLKYADKVIANAEYAEQLKEAKGLSSAIRKATKSKDKSAALKQAAREFLQVNPNAVEDIAEYNKIATSIKDALRGVRTFKGETKGDTPTISNEEIGKYTAGQVSKQNESTKQDLADAYPELMDVMREEIAEKAFGKKIEDLTAEEAATIDSSIPLEELQELIDAAAEGDEAFDAKLAAMDRLAQKEDALRKLAKYKILDLESYIEESTNALLGGDADRFSPRENKILKGIKDIDIDALSAKDLVLLNNTISNITTNNDFSNAGKVQVIAEGQQAFKQMKPALAKLGYSPGTVGRIAKGFANNSLLFEFITKSSKAAAEMQRYFSIRGLQDANSRVQQKNAKVYNDYIKLRDSLSSAVASNENRLQRGAYAYAIQNTGGTDAEVQAEFDRRKNWIKQTYEKMLSPEATKAEQQEGTLIKEAYDAVLANSATGADAKAALSAENLKIVDFFMKQNEARVDALEESAIIDNNEEFTRWNNYTPTKMKGFGGQTVSGSEIQDFASAYFSKKIVADAAGSKKSRTQNQNLPQNMLVDLDFDKVQLDKLHEADYDIETSHDTNKIAWMLKQKDALEVLGGADNRNIVSNSVVNTLKAQRGNTVPMSDIAKGINKVLNSVQAKAARMALAGVSQVIKQPTVLTATVASLGADAPLFAKAVSDYMTNPDAQKLINAGEIGDRGSTQAGYNKEAVSKTLDAMKHTKVGKTIDAVNAATEKVSELVFSPLTRSDVFAAKTAFLAYYMQDLKNRGLELDYNVRDEEAAAYAEQMVQRYQGANSTSSMAEFYKDSTQNVVKNLLLPYSTFATTQKVALAADMKKIATGNIREGVSGIGSRLVEAVAYNTVKAFLVAPVITAIAGKAIEGLDLYDNENKKEREKREAYEEEQKTAKVKAGRAAEGAFRDFFFSGIGSIPQATIEQSFNKAAKLIRGDDEDLFYQFKDKRNDARAVDVSALGVYGGAINKAQDLVAAAPSVFTGETKRVVKGGVKPEFEDAELTDSQYRGLAITWLVDALALSGISDADILAINEKIKKQVRKNIEDVHGGNVIKITQKGDKGSGSKQKPIPLKK